MEKLAYLANKEKIDRSLKIKLPELSRSLQKSHTLPKISSPRSSLIPSSKRCSFESFGTDLAVLGSLPPLKINSYHRGDYCASPIREEESLLNSQKDETLNFLVKNL